MTHKQFMAWQSWLSIRNGENQDRVATQEEMTGGAPGTGSESAWLGFMDRAKKAQQKRKDKGKAVSES